MSGYFSWSKVFAAESYRLVVSENADFSNPVLDVTAIYPSYNLSSLTSRCFYYWHVCAYNSNGFGSWSETWSFTAGAAAGSGCPFVYTWDGNKFIEDNNILPQSEYDTTTGTDVTDFYRLLKPMVLKNNEYVLRVKEYEHEKSRFDQFRLFVVDHPVGTRIAINDQGDITMYRTLYRLAQASLGSKDVRAKLLQFDSVMVTANAGDVFNLSFQSGFEKIGPLLNSGEIGEEIGGEEDPGHSTKKATAGRISTGMMEHARSKFTFRQRPTLIYASLGQVSSTNLALQIDEKCLLDYVNLAVRLPDNYEINELSLTRAVHSSSGIITEALEDNDQVYGILEPGQSIELHFSGLPSVIGKQRSFIFVSEGRYQRITNKSESIIPSSPQSFTFNSCYPNPFNPQTTVQYSLSAPSHVSLIVYNMLGQKVVQLVDAEQAAGYYTTTWNASTVASGIYYLRMVVTDAVGKQLYQGSRKLLLMK